MYEIEVTLRLSEKGSYRELLKVPATIHVQEGATQNEIKSLVQSLCNMIQKTPIKLPKVDKD